MKEVIWLLLSRLFLPFFIDYGLYRIFLHYINEKYVVN